MGVLMEDLRFDIFRGAIGTGDEEWLEAVCGRENARQRTLEGSRCLHQGGNPRSPELVGGDSHDSRSAVACSAPQPQPPSTLRGGRPEWRGFWLDVRSGRKSYGK